MHTIVQYMQGHFAVEIFPNDKKTLVCINEHLISITSNVIHHISYHSFKVMSI